MSNVNDFKAFGIDPSATTNLDTQAEYLASLYLNAGFVSGVAPRKGFNKAWRQATSIAHILAQLMSDTLAEDVLDNGNMTTLQDQLARTIKVLANADIRFFSDTFVWGAGPFVLTHLPNAIMVPRADLDGVRQPDETDGSVYTRAGVNITVVAHDPPFGQKFTVFYAYTP